MLSEAGTALIREREIYITNRSLNLIEDLNCAFTDFSKFIACAASFSGAVGIVGISNATFIAGMCRAYPSFNRWLINFLNIANRSSVENGLFVGYQPAMRELVSFTSKMTLATAVSAFSYMVGLKLDKRIDEMKAHRTTVNYNMKELDALYEEIDYVKY